MMILPLTMASSRPLDHPGPIRLFDDGNGFMVKLMTNIHYDKLNFEDCYKQAEIHNVDGISIPVIHVHHLIKWKEKIKMKNKIWTKDQSKMILLRIGCLDGICLFNQLDFSLYLNFTILFRFETEVPNIAFFKKH